MKIQSYAVGKPVVSTDNLLTVAGVSPAHATASDPDRPVIVMDASNADLEAMRAAKMHERYVCYSLLMIVMLFLLGCLSVALAFAYLNLTDSVDD